MPGPQTERVAVVTGGSRGIGRAVAKRLADDGFRVHALGRDESALEETAALGERITGVRCDVTDPEQITETFGSIGRVDILVNNAGAASSNPLPRITLEEWQRMLAVNATGVLLCSQAVLPAMREGDWGRIVTIASVASHRGAKYIGAYAASKHAVLGLMRSIAMEVAGTGVTANSVCPAYVRTEMTAQAIANIVRRTDLTEPAAERHLSSSVPLGRLVEPEEVAHAVSFLVSEGAAAVNGQSIVLDGGGIQH